MAAAAVIASRANGGGGGGDRYYVEEATRAHSFIRPIDSASSQRALQLPRLEPFSATYYSLCSRAAAVIVKASAAAAAAGKYAPARARGPRLTLTDGRTDGQPFLP